MKSVSPVEALKTAVESYQPYLRDSGELEDPVFGEPTQYGTAYYALCNAALAILGDGNPASTDRAVRGLRASLAHLTNPSRPPTASGFQRNTGTVNRTNHRDFYWPPILKTFRILKGLGDPSATEFARLISDVDVERAFRTRPPSNWAAVWLSGEWLRLREDLSPYSVEDMDRWIGVFFENRILPDRGLYQEPGHSNSYDLFTRYHLAEILKEGYDGRWRDGLEHLMHTGLTRSFGVQLSDGSLASAHRSTGQTWTLGAQCAYFIHAANYFWERDPDLARRAAAAASLAFSSFCRWQREKAPYSPVENLLAPGYRVGYETYSSDGHYGPLAMAFLASALLDGGTDRLRQEDVVPREDTLHIEQDPTYRALVHAGRCSLQVNANPVPDYDGFGVVDMTFGPERFLHFVSSTRHLESGLTYNLGLAHRSEPGRSELEVVAHQNLTLLGNIAENDPSLGLRLEGRVLGKPYTYRLLVEARNDAFFVRESTPGLEGYKTLLVPYLRDAGTGATTTVRFQEGGIRLTLGEEEIGISFEARVDYILHVPYGFESRRGLCGMLRVDFEEPCEALSYEVGIIR